MIECKDGVCYLVEATNAVSSAVAETTTRVAQGYMGTDAFLAFLSNTGDPQVLTGLGLGTLAIVFLGGLALNLTPCVLPMIPVNLLVIGQSVRRGFAYASGMALAYGALGLLAAMGGLAFGTLQSSPFFNGVVALVFVLLALSTLGVFRIDFSRRRPTGSAFALGAFSAILAGACVAPVVLSVLLLTADAYARGRVWALGLPFVLGLGMALPWPFAAAGFKVLPKPGAWMKGVNRLFAVFLFALAAWYAYLALPKTFGGREAAILTPETLPTALATAPRPVLVDCGASWCKNCAAMERSTLVQPEVRKALQAFTVLRVQADDIEALRRIPGFFAVRGLPAFVIFP